MRQFRSTQHYSLPIKSKTLIGNAYKLELIDCSIFIPYLWVKRTKRDNKGQLRVFLSDYFSREVARKIVNAGGKLGRYKELTDLLK
jgi:hypothetical protein